MFSQRWPIILGIGCVCTLGLLTAVLAQQQPAQPKGFKKVGDKKHLNEVIQEFPSNDRMRTAWKVRWMTTQGYGLIIQDAYFKKGPKDDWMQVVGDCRLTESFVPYHRGSPRFWDVSYNFNLHTVTAVDAGAKGKLLSDRPGASPTVVMEVRDRGLMFKDSRAGTRRGQELVVWGALAAANYCYVIEYSFRDDGSIGFKLGNTGHNYGGSEWVGHMHHAMWRVDVNLDGPANNTAELVEHLEPHPNGDKKQALSKVSPFNGGVEGGEKYVAEKFTMVRIRHADKKNAQGKYLAYDLMPARQGNARHFGGGSAKQHENCSENDYWVSISRPDQVYIGAIKEYVKGREKIEDADVVLWYHAPAHHEPRSEDGEFRGSSFHGVTPVLWSSFELKPRNIWDRSPYYEK